MPSWMHKRIWFWRWENIDKNGNKHSKWRHILDVLVCTLSYKSYTYRYTNTLTRRYVLSHHHNGCWAAASKILAHSCMYRSTATCRWTFRIFILFLFLSSRFIFCQLAILVYRSSVGFPKFWIGFDLPWGFVVSRQEGKWRALSLFADLFSVFERVQNDFHRFENNEISTIIEKSIDLVVTSRKT